MAVTARMTRHAVDRCAEMGISTKVAKWILSSHQGITRPSGTNRDGREVRIAVSERLDLREFAVVYYPDDPPLVLTVVFRTLERYRRNGAVFDPVVDECV
jgi:hypothetical protein